MVLLHDFRLLLLPRLLLALGRPIRDGPAFNAGTPALGAHLQSATARPPAAPPSPPASETHPGDRLREPPNSRGFPTAGKALSLRAPCSEWRSFHDGKVAETTSQERGGEWSSPRTRSPVLSMAETEQSTARQRSFFNFFWPKVPSLSRQALREGSFGVDRGEAPRLRSQRLFCAMLCATLAPFFAPWPLRFRIPCCCPLLRHQSIHSAETVDSRPPVAVRAHRSAAGPGLRSAG